MPKFYEKRRQKYYAVLDVPKAFREQLGVSRRFVKSLQTDSESIARIRVLPVIAKWKQEIALAKVSGNSGNHLLDIVVKVRQDAQRLKAQGLDDHDIQWIHEDVAKSLQTSICESQFTSEERFTKRGLMPFQTAKVTLYLRVGSFEKIRCPKLNLPTISHNK